MDITNLKFFGIINIARAYFHLSLKPFVVECHIYIDPFGFFIGDFEILSINGLEGDSRRETQMKKAVEERERADREEQARLDALNKVGRCRLTVSKPVLEAPRFQRLKAQYDETLSNLAFEFNLRRYNKEKAKKCDTQPCWTCAESEAGSPIEMLCAGAGNVISDVVSALYTTTASKPIWTPVTALGLCDPKTTPINLVGRCRLTLSKTRVESAYGVSA